MRARSRLLFAVAPPATAAALGAAAARDAPRIYERLEKPRWAPPGWVFGPVWSVLYTIVGVVGWRETKRPHRAAMAVHVAQLGLNASWTPLFFSAGRRRAALTVSALLDLAIAAEMSVVARDGDRAAAALLAPYLAWCGFATALAAGVSAPER
jgi:translocator protein